VAHRYTSHIGLRTMSDLLRTCNRWRYRWLALQRQILLALSLFAIYGSAVSCASSADAQSAHKAAAVPLQYRRVFVPADKIDAWPRNGEKLIPIESRDFDRWIGAANASELARTGGATVESAEYTASLDDNGRLQGQGQWKVVVRGDSPAFLPL